MPPNVISFFAKRARDYQNDAESLPWRWLRTRERAAVGQAMGDVTDGDVLDLGSGVGYYSRYFLGEGARRITAVDISPEMIAALPKGPIDGVEGDISSINLGKTFSHIICAGSLEFVPDVLGALKSARRHADMGTRMVLLIPRPNFWGDLYRLYHRQHRINVTLFPPDQLIEMAQQADWKLISGESAALFSWVGSFGVNNS